MPTYDYECTKCGKSHQAEHAMSAKKPDCPSCGSELTQVFLMAPAISGATSGTDDTAPCEAPGGTCATGTCPFVQ